MLALSLAIFLGTGEAALRIIYRDAGKRTLGGPGGHQFEHLTIRNDQRGRLDAGPKKTGVPRIMIVGDSITWGQGVRNWQDVWPEQLALALERAGTPHEMTVFAMPGRDIPAHVEETAYWAPRINPDVFIYQWYVNDVEVNPHRPANAHTWQDWAGHEWLRLHSYLYYFVHNRLAAFLPPPDRSYVQYILEDYAPGSIEWTEFERYFHTLATRAKEVARTRMLVIYPQVPFEGTSPLQPIHDRVRAMAGAHRLSVPPLAWVRYVGNLVERPDAPWRQALHVPASVRGPVIETHDYYMPAGASDVVLTVALDSPAPAHAGIGTLDFIDIVTNQVVATFPVPAAAGQQDWQELTVHTQIPAPGRTVRLRVTSGGAAPFTLGRLDIPVDYGMTVVDLTEALNAFDTHASIFDAHPNEAAHRIIAERVSEALQKLKSQ